MSDLNRQAFHAAFVSDFLITKAMAAIINASQRIFDSLSKDEQAIVSGCHLGDEEKEDVEYFDNRLALLLDEATEAQHHWSIWLPIVRELQVQANDLIFNGWSKGMLKVMHLAATTIDNKEYPTNSTESPTIFSSAGEVIA